MANVISPFGAQDYVHQGGSQRTEELATVWIASSDPTPIFNGDLVSTYNPTAALLTGGFGPYITQGTSAAGPWKGVFRQCEYFNPATQRMVVSRYWPGSGVAGTSSMTGDVKAQIISDSAYRFTLQGSSLATLFGSSNTGQAISVAVNGVVGTPSSAGGNPATQLSGMQAGSSGTTAVGSAVSAFPFRLVDLLSNTAPGNPLSGFPGVGSSLGIINGTDNTTPGQILIVEPLNWESRAF